MQKSLCSWWQKQNIHWFQWAQDLYEVIWFSLICISLSVENQRITNLTFCCFRCCTNAKVLLTFCLSLSKTTLHNYMQDTNLLKRELEVACLSCKWQLGPCLHPGVRKFRWYLMSYTSAFKVKTGILFQLFSSLCVTKKCRTPYSLLWICPERCSAKYRRLSYLRCKKKKGHVGSVLPWRGEAGGQATWCALCHTEVPRETSVRHTACNHFVQPCSL